MIREAKEEVIVSTFDFNADTGGKDVMSALIEAAHRNVHVRLIVDGISGFLDMLGDPYFQALASTDNIEVKVYNPVNLLKPWTMQARLHDKYVITDSSMYLLAEEIRPICFWEIMESIRILTKRFLSMQRKEKVPL